MQFYLDGYRAGDPRIEPADAAVLNRQDSVPDKVDVLVVGCGPAGLVMAAQLAQFPDIVTAVVDAQGGPSQVGRADGVACRTVEMIEAFGLAEQLIGEAYWVNEVTFWQPDPAVRARITRTGRLRDTEGRLVGVPARHRQPGAHAGLLRERMHRSSSRLQPHYCLRVEDLVVDRTEARTHPVTVTLANTETGARSTVRARYVVGCDGHCNRAAEPQAA